jgi:hypothetical protein
MSIRQNCPTLSFALEVEKQLLEGLMETNREMKSIQIIVSRKAIGISSRQRMNPNKKELWNGRSSTIWRGVRGERKDHGEIPNDEKNFGTTMAR